MLACLPGQTSLSVSLVLFALLCMIIQTSKPILAFCAVCFGPIICAFTVWVISKQFLLYLSENSILVFLNVYMLWFKIKLSWYDMLTWLVSKVVFGSFYCCCVNIKSPNHWTCQCKPSEQCLEHLSILEKWQCNLKIISFLAVCGETTLWFLLSLVMPELLPVTYLRRCSLISCPDTLPASQTCSK